MMSSEQYLFRLFITRNAPNSEIAIANLQCICDDYLPGRSQLIIIDVLTDSQLAQQENILITPTLIKELPLPTLRLVGDLSSLEFILSALEINRRSQGNGSPPPAIDGNGDSHL